MGLAYRYWSKRVGIQIVGSPIGLQNLSITGLYRFYESRSSCFFGYLGNVFYESLRDVSSYSYDPNQPMPALNRKYKKELGYSVGIGPGFSFGRKVRFNIMAGVMLMNANDRNNICVNPTAELGLFYRF